VSDGAPGPLPPVHIRSRAIMAEVEVEEGAKKKRSSFFGGSSRRSSSTGKRGSISKLFTRRRSSSGGAAGAIPAQVSQWIDVDGYGVGRVVAFHKTTLGAMPGVHHKYEIDFTLNEGEHKVVKLHLKRYPRPPAGAAEEEGGGDEEEDVSASPSAAGAAEDDASASSSTSSSPRPRRRSTFSGLQYSICHPAVQEDMQQAVDMGFTAKADHDQCMMMGFVSKSRFEHCLEMGFTEKEDYDACFKMGFDDRLEYEECKALGLSSKKEYLAHGRSRKSLLQRLEAAGSPTPSEDGDDSSAAESRNIGVLRATALVKKLAAGKLAAAWRTWRTAVQLARIAAGILKKWTGRRLAAAWRKWWRSVQLSRIALGILKRWHNRRAAAALNRWWRFVEFTRVAERIVQNWHNRRMAGAWRQWWAVCEMERKKEAERALHRRVRKLEKAAAEDAKLKEKMAAELKAKEEALKKKEEALAQERQRTERSERQLARVKREYAKRRAGDGADSKGGGKRDGSGSTRRGGRGGALKNSANAPRDDPDKYLQLGFSVKSEYEEYLEMGFLGSSREAFGECLSLGLDNKEDYERFKRLGFTDAAAYIEFKKAGFLTTEEFEHSKKLGCGSKVEYDEYMALRSARTKVRGLHRLHSFASGHYCLLRTIEVTNAGGGYDSAAPAPMVVLKGVSEPIGRAVVREEVRWEQCRDTDTLQVGCRVRFKRTKEAKVASVSTWCFSCDIFLDEGGSKIEQVRAADLEVGVVGSIQSIEIDEAVLESLLPAESTALGEWQPPSFEIIGKCSRAASLKATPATPVVNCLRDERVRVVDTITTYAPGKYRVLFEGTILGFDEEAGLYSFRKDGQSYAVPDFEPQSEGLGEVRSVEPSTRYQVGTELFLFLGDDGGSWASAKVLSMDSNDGEQEATTSDGEQQQQQQQQQQPRPRHLLEINGAHERRIDLNSANHGLRISTTSIGPEKWNFEDNIEAFFTKISSKYSSLEDKITTVPIQLRDIAAYGLTPSGTSAGESTDIRQLAKELLDVQRTEEGGMCYHHIALTGESGCGKTMACLQLVLEIIDLQRHQVVPPPDIPLYVSVKRLCKGVNAPRILSLSKYFESDDFSPSESLVLKQAFELRRLIILLDGLDEAAGRGSATFRFASALAQAGHRCVVTCRPEGLLDSKPHLLASGYYSQLDVAPLGAEDRWDLVVRQILTLESHARGHAETLLKLTSYENNAQQRRNLSEELCGIGAADEMLALLVDIASDPVLMSMMLASLQSSCSQELWVPSSLGHLFEAALNAVLSRFPKEGHTYLLLRDIASDVHLKRCREFRVTDLSKECSRSFGANWKASGRSLPLLDVLVAPAKDKSVQGGVFQFSHLQVQEYLAAKQLSEAILNRAEGSTLPLLLDAEKVAELLNDDFYAQTMRIVCEELGDQCGLFFDAICPLFALPEHSNTAAVHEEDSSIARSCGAINLGNGQLKSWGVFSTIFGGNTTVVSMNLSRCSELGRSLGAEGIAEIFSLLESTNVSAIDLSGSDVAGDIGALEKYQRLASSLRSLSLQGCARITGDISVFKVTREIRSLVLYDTDCHGDVEVFSKTPALEKLWLSGTSCGGDIEVFRELKRLRVLGLQETECQGSEMDIRAALPRCSMTFTLTPSGKRALPLYSPAKLKSSNRSGGRSRLSDTIKLIRPAQEVVGGQDAARRRLRF
jgi:hypothetical protein